MVPPQPSMPFIMRVNMPLSSDDRAEFRLEFPSEHSFEHLINCIASKSFGVEQHARALAEASRAVMVATDAIMNDGKVLSEEEEIARNRQTAFHVLDGTLPQRKTRDYPGKLKWLFDEFERQEEQVAEVTAKFKEARQPDDHSAGFKWSVFHFMLKTQLSVTDRARLPPCLGDRLKPILLQLKPRTESTNPVDRVAKARNIEAASIIQFRQVMKDVARKGWEDHVLWVCDPEGEQAIPQAIKRRSWDPNPMVLSQNLI